MNISEVVNVLTEFNTWRSGLPPYEWNEDPTKQKELQYSAKEIGLAIDDAVAMLRQSLDMMERERRYEYAVKVTDILDQDICCIYKSADLQDAKDLAEAMKDPESIVTVIRRELVDWEEVPNEE